MFTWKITYGTGKDKREILSKNVGHLCNNLASLARNAKSDKFTVEKIKEKD